MKYLHWAAILLAGLASFVCVGLACAYLLLRHGRALYGWHDTAAPEVLTGAVIGGVVGLLVIAWLARRLRAKATA